VVKIDLTASIEDYLEAISILSSRNKTVRVKDIAAFLDVKMPSVNSALRVLKEKELITHEAYGHVELTEKGLEKAQEIYKRHRLISKFFQEILNVPYEIADEDACRVEHVVSPETLENLTAFMALIEQYGDNKPDWLENFREQMKGKRFKVSSEDFIDKGYTALPNAREGKQFIIKGIDGGVNLKKKVAILGLLPDTVCDVISIQGDQVILDVKGTKIALGGGMASKIWGKVSS
jgi:DtxR family Mn-dependent transcriptional regulator